MSDSPSQARVSPSEIVGKMAGEYRLGRLLGEGGFGAVYEAEHPLLKRRAAVKVLHRVADRDSDAVQRFISEAQAVNQIRSRHIIDVFSFGTLADGRHFYVMDFLEGEPLDSFLKRVGRVDVATALQLLQPIAEALDLAHGAGIIHRDLKPQNIFLAWDKNGEVIPKLLDFGMAKLLANSPVRTVSGTPIGTPLYMAPEQARGGKVDSRCDVYALGVLCYEMLVGNVPFDGETTVAILMAHVIQVPERPSEVSDLSAEFDAPLLRMLEKNPDQRPSSAGEAWTSLRQAAERAGITVSAGLPKLPRPEPTTSGEFASEVASTLLADPPTPEQGTEVSLREARSAAERVRRRPWLALVVLMLAGTGLTLWLRPNRTAPARPLPAASSAEAPRATHSAPVEAPTQNVEPTPSAALDAQTTQPVEAAASALPTGKRPKPSTVDTKSRKRTEAALVPLTPTPATSATPRDLESPFGP